MSIKIFDKTNYAGRRNMIWGWGFMALGISLSIMTALLVVDGSWLIALGLIVAVPALVLIARHPFLGLLLWLLLTPFLVDTDGGAIRKVYWVIHRAVPPALVGMIVIASLLGIRRYKLPRPGWAEVAMAGYVIVSVLSILYLSHTVKATLVHYYDRVIIPMCLYLFVRFLNPGEKELQWLLPVLIFIVISQSIIGLLSWVVPQVLPKVWLDRAGVRTTGSLRSYSVFTSTLVFCGLFILHAALNQTALIRRFWYMVLFAVTNVMIFLSFSRGSWLAGIVVLGGLIYLYPWFISRYAGAAILVVFLAISGGLMSDYLDWAHHRLYSDQSKEEAMSRLPIYYASYRMFETKPLFGWGFGNFDRYDRQFQERVVDFNAEKDHASHNVYLTLITEQGLIGLSLFMLPVFWWLNQTLIAWTKIPGDGFINRNLIIMFWLVILFHFIVNNFSNMRVVFGLGMWWITLGLIASLVTSHQTRRSVPEGPQLFLSSETKKNGAQHKVIW